jgi:RimJ/RimL family protein N-acetyltransferase
MLRASAGLTTRRECNSASGSGTKPSNRPSYRVLKKIGMRREGHLRQNVWVKGAWVDSLIYAVLDTEGQA